MEKKTLIKYLKPYTKAMAFGLFIKLIGTFADLGLPRVLALILNKIIPQNNIGLVFIWGGIMVVLAVLARLFNIIANRRASRVASDVTCTIRHDLFEKINRLSGRQMDKFSIPSLISRMTADSYNINRTIGSMQRMGVRAPILMLGGLIITATMDPVMTLVLLAVIPILVLIVFGISRKTIPMFKNVQEKLDRLVDVLRENITGIRVIKALSKTEHEKKRFRGVNDELVDVELKAAYTMAASSPLMNFVLNMGLVGVIIVGAYRVNRGVALPGTIIAVLSYFAMILNSILMMNRILIQINQMSASSTRIMEVLSEPEDLVPLLPENTPAEYFAENGISCEEVPGAPLISFENVSFRYSEGGDLCLENINLNIKKGESLGIIGATGCGKTTVVNLLMRFYDVTSGAVRINGRDVRTMPVDELHKRFGVAFQNDVIFADTIYENISFCRNLEQTLVEEAAEDAQGGFINELGAGTDESKFMYRAAIKGANLSGGQKQRLLIARAFAGKPEILILDDSSSALDYKTDANLRKAIRKNYDDSTLIMIAQRVSSVMYCDNICVMDDGRIIGYGKHEDLLKNCEVYREIYSMQMEA